MPPRPGQSLAEPDAWPHLPLYFKPARPGFERDWRRVGAPVPTGAGQGKPELTEARRAEGVPEGPSRPSVVDGSIRSLGAAKSQVEQV